MLEVATVPSGVGILQGPSQLLTLANQHHPNSCNRPNSQYCPNSQHCPKLGGNFHQHVPTCWMGLHWGGATSISTSQPVGLTSIRDSHNFQARTSQLLALASSQLNSCNRPNLHFPTPLGMVNFQVSTSQLPQGVPSTWDSRKFQTRTSQLSALASQQHPI